MAQSKGHWLAFLVNGLLPQQPFHGVNLLPSFVMLLIALLSPLPSILPEILVGNIAFLWLAMIYWALIRPETISYLVLFVIGLIYDLLLMAPIGMSSFILLLGAYLTLKWRKYTIRMGFFAWWGLALALIMIMGLGEYLLMALLANHLFDPSSILFSSIVSWAFFPAIVTMMVPISRYISKINPS